jgi:hypothetical protein
MTKALLLFCVLNAVLFISCSRARLISSDQSDTSSVLFYGADPTGQKDASEAFRKALSSNHIMLIVPRGRYIVNETIELKKHLRLMPGVVIEKTSEGNNGPIFWLSKSYAKLEGLNKRVEIRSKRTVPNGIVKIGHQNRKIKGNNILFIEVENITITGPGPSRGNDNIGLYMFNAQAKGDGTTTSYFHTINNVILQHLDCGIFMKGMSNANSISNIILNRVGLGDEDAAIHLVGAMENRIYDVFHHHSKNATTLLMNSYKDQNNALIKPSFNYISQIVSEQGGESAKCADIKSGYSNSIGLLCNSNGGNIRFDNFKADKNVMQIN